MLQIWGEKNKEIFWKQKVGRNRKWKKKKKEEEGKSKRERKKFFLPFLYSQEKLSRALLESVLEYSDSLLMVFLKKRERNGPNVCFSKSFDSKAIQL